jgi:hypothetical protein
MTGLVSELAAVGYRPPERRHAQRRRAHEDMGARRNAIAHAYVHFAYDNPAMFGLMFRNEMIDMARPTLNDAAREAMRVMAAIIGAKDATADDTPVSLSGTEAMRITAAWGYVHGLAILLIDQRLRGIIKVTPDSTDEELVRSRFGFDKALIRRRALRLRVAPGREEGEADTKCSQLSPGSALPVAVLPLRFETRRAGTATAPDGSAASTCRNTRSKPRVSAACASPASTRPARPRPALRLVGAHAVHAGPAVAERHRAGGHRAAAFAHAGVERALGARQRAHAVRAVHRVETLAEKQRGPGVVGGAVDIGQCAAPGAATCRICCAEPICTQVGVVGLVVPALQLGAQALEAGGVGQPQRGHDLAAVGSGPRCGRAWPAPPRCGAAARQTWRASRCLRRRAAASRRFLR